MLFFSLYSLNLVCYEDCGLNIQIDHMSLVRFGIFFFAFHVRYVVRRSLPNKIKNVCWEMHMTAMKMRNIILPMNICENDVRGKL